MKSPVPFARPKPLSPGALIRVVAPAGPFEPALFEAGLAVLRQRYRVEFDPGIHSKQRYLAGPDRRRLEELQQALGAPDVSAVFCARGGYGAMRLLRGLDLKAPLPVLAGFSDITALHLAAQAKGHASLHAPVLTQLGKQPPEVVERLFALLEGETPPPPLLGSTTFVGGVADGPLIGGNLSVLTRLLGTPYLPDLRGAVLLLEDVTERPYRIDRMWTHLSLAGVFEQVAGIVLGDFTGCDEKEPPYTALELLSELAAQAGVPCAAGFRVGHGEVNLPVPLGTRVRLDASGSRLEFLESFVQSERRS